MPPAGVTTSKLDLAFEGDRFVSLTEALGLECLGMRLLVLAPRQRNRIHEHREQEEVYVVLAGELTIAFGEGDELAVGPNEVVRVAPAVRRRLQNRGAERAYVLAIGAAGSHEVADATAYTDWSDTTGAPPLEVPYPDDLPA